MSVRLRQVNILLFQNLISFNTGDEKQTVDGSHIKVPHTGTSDKQSGGQNNYCHVKFEKLRKAANNLHWRAKNLDAWNKLADEYRHIGEKLLMYNMYQVEHEENMPVDQRDWYDCQLLWWSNNLQDKDEHIPEACDNKLERFQLEKTVVAPSEWKKLRMMDTGTVHNMCQVQRRTVDSEFFGRILLSLIALKDTLVM